MSLDRYKPINEGEEIPVSEVAVERLRRSIKELSDRSAFLTEKRHSLMNELFRNQQEERKNREQTIQLERSVDALLAT